MCRKYLYSLVLIFPVLDLSVAYIYSLTGASTVEYIRYARDASVLFVAITAFIRGELPESLRRPMLLYGLFILIHMPIGVMNGVPLNTVISSSGTLILPVILTTVGYYCVESEDHFLSTWATLMIVGFLSTVFGAWDVNNTEFWTDSVNYGDYIYDVKKSITGFEPLTELPWNFFGYEDTRRAAGLLAAPLAQGSFLVVLLVTGFAYFRHRFLFIAFAIISVYSFGIYQSGTRGAMLIGVTSLVFYLIVSSLQTAPSVSGSVFTRNFIILLILTTAVVVGLGETIVYSINLADGSTIGHLIALEKNISEFGRILVIGEGVGRQGAIAAQQDLEVIGGGEGAFFTIAYQLGLPGVLAFLWFYISLYKSLYSAKNRLEGSMREISVSLAALAIGIVVTFASSEHILTFSGMAAYWILAGGTVRVMQLGGLSELGTEIS